MSFIMVYVMELYNKVLIVNDINYPIMLEVLEEGWWLTIVVLIIQLCFVAPFAKKIAFSIVNYESDQPYILTLTIGIVTVCMMCPIMSFIATLLFKQYQGNLIPIWLKTVVVNFPMAFFFQLLFAGPLVRQIYKTIRKREFKS